MEMTAEDKDIIMKEICTRLPYGVKVYRGRLLNVVSVRPWDVYPVNAVALGADGYMPGNYQIDDVALCLRPIASMTEIEEKEFYKTLEEVYDFTFRMEELLEELKMQKTIPCRAIDWLNQHDFDYRGLIERGLAVDLNSIQDKSNL